MSRFLQTTSVWIIGLKSWFAAMFILYPLWVIGVYLHFLFVDGRIAELGHLRNLLAISIYMLAMLIFSLSPTFMIGVSAVILYRTNFHSIKYALSVLLVGFAAFASCFLFDNWEPDFDREYDTRTTSERAFTFIRYTLSLSVHASIFVLALCLANRKAAQRRQISN